MGFIKLCIIKRVKHNFISRSMTKRSFCLRGFNTKVLLEEKIVSCTRTLSVREKTYATFNHSAKIRKKNTVGQIQFLLVNTKYINLSSLFPNYWIYLFHSPLNFCIQGYLIK